MLALGVADYYDWFDPGLAAKEIVQALLVGELDYGYILLILISFNFLILISQQLFLNILFDLINHILQIIILLIFILTLPLISHPWYPGRILLILLEVSLLGNVAEFVLEEEFTWVLLGVVVFVVVVMQVGDAGGVRGRY